MKRGRPKLKASERQSLTITVRMTTAERKQLDTAAKASSQKLSDWIRAQLLKAANSERSVAVAVKQPEVTAHFWSYEGIRLEIQELTPETWKILKGFVEIIEP